jgi:hypothetical protein
MLNNPTAAVLADQSLVQEMLFGLGRNEGILTGKGVRPLGPSLFLTVFERGEYP